MQREYSYIFAALVGPGDDLVQMTAYTLYKRRKVEHIKQFVERNQREPNNDELQQFTKENSSEMAIKGYIADAEKLVASITTEILEAEVKRKDSKLIEKALKKKGEEIEQLYVQKLKDVKLKYSFPIFLASMRDGIVGNIGFVILLFVLALLLKASTVSMADLIRKVFE